MRTVCPIEIRFDQAIERAKESLRKCRQRHNENLEDRRQHSLQLSLHRQIQIVVRHLYKQHVDYD